MNNDELSILDSLWDEVVGIEGESSDSTKPDWMDRKRTTFEDSLVRYTLNRLEMGHVIKHMTEESRSISGYTPRPLLNLTSMHECVDLPLRLFSDPFLRSVTVEDLLTRFTKTGLYRSFTAARAELESYGESRSIGVVFPFVHVGMMIVHDSELFSSDAYFVRKLNSGKTTVYVAQYKQVLDELAKKLAR